jgi:hypothetical protein
MTVYLSYRDDDDRIASKLKSALRNAGLNVVDRHSTEAYWNSAIADCAVFAICCSRGSVNDNEVAVALKRVSKQPCPILVLKVEGKAVPESLSGFPIYRVEEWDEFVQKIVLHAGTPSGSKSRAREKKRSSVSSIKIRAKNLVVTEKADLSGNTHITTTDEAVIKNLRTREGK